MKYFLKLGVDFLLKDGNGWKFVYYVVWGGNFVVIELFFSDVEEIDFRVNWGEMLLMIVGYYGNF